MFSAKSLSKRFGEQKALDGVSLDAQAGEIILLLGSNGAGKSTFLRICAGLSRPDSGELIGLTRDQLGYFSHQSMMYAGFSLYEQLSFITSIRGIGSDLNKGLTRWNLELHASKAIKDLSQGQKARASLLQAFIHRPSLLFLDEPSSALDDSSVEILCSQVKSAAQEGATVLLATHDISRLEQLASRVVVLTSGMLAFDSQTESVSASEGVSFYRSTNR